MRLLLLVVFLLAPMTSAQPLAFASVLPATAVVDVQKMVDPPAVSVYPHPVVDVSTVQFQVERAQRFELAVFDLLGRRVKHEELGHLGAGSHEVRMNLSQLPVGLYIVRLSGDAGSRATIRVTRSAGA